jgi:NADH:ubiquinone reductase (non-electrogenic)
VSVTLPFKQLIVLGTGFGAYSLLRTAGRKYARIAEDIIVISPRNHFVFTPLLASTTVGSLEFRSVIESVRLRTPGRFLLAEATGIDWDRGAVLCRSALDGGTFELPFNRDSDALVVAVGAQTQTFGIPGVVEHALFLKQINDARRIRQRIFACLELASLPTLSDDERRRLLHFVVVGGGPTGVEFAAEMFDFAASDLKRAYPNLVQDVSITLVDAGKHLLSSYDATLSAYTEKHFARQSIQVLKETHVVRVEADRLHFKDGGELSFGCLVWATGNAPTPLVKSLPFAKDKTGRLLIDEYLKVDGAPHLYALGDCAVLNENPIPATAQAAEQQGTYLAKALTMRAAGREPVPFRYIHQGMLAYVGGHSGVADLGRFKGRGFAAFLFWRSVYLTKLVSLRNKVMVLFDWARTFIFGRDISRM